MPPIYRQGNDDSDGKEYLYHASMRDIFAVNESAGWATPGASNHWGAALNGSYYAEGQVCYAGPFSVGAEVNPRSWRNTDTEPFRAQADYLGFATGGLAPGNLTIPTSGAVQFNTQGSPPGAYTTACLIDSLRKWKFLAGQDFEVSFDASNFSMSGTDWLFGIFVAQNINAADASNFLSIHALGDLSKWHMERYQNGGRVFQQGATGGFSSIQLRIKRDDEALTMYYDIGGGLTQCGPTYTTITVCTSDVYVGVALVHRNCVGNVRASNFQVISGTPSTKAGWATEASGTHRGEQDASPNSSVIVGTDQSVDIINTSNIDDALLWKRAVLPTAGLLDESAASSWPLRVKIRDGVLLIVYYRSGNNVVRLVDFTGDYCLNFAHAGTYAGVFMNGNETRIDGLGDWNSWFGGPTGWTTKHADGTFVYQATDGNSVKDADIYFEGDYQYEAIAAAGGVTVFKHQRWHIWDSPRRQRALSTETGTILSCEFDQTTGDLYYMTSTTIYRASKSTWEAGMGGTFSANSSKAVPGTQSILSQQRLCSAAEEVFIAADEGIYVVNVISGTSALCYGESGSGALYEILPAYDRVSSISVNSDRIYATGKNVTDYWSAVIDRATNQLLTNHDVTVVMGAEPVAVAGYEL